LVVGVCICCVLFVDLAHALQARLENKTTAIFCFIILLEIIRLNIDKTILVRDVKDINSGFVIQISE